MFSSAEFHVHPGEYEQNFTCNEQSFALVLIAISDITVDDASTDEGLGADLEEYMAQFVRVRILRLRERSGLIRARLAGIAEASSQILTFLDSHCEVDMELHIIVLYSMYTTHWGF